MRGAHRRIAILVGWVAVLGGCATLEDQAHDSTTPEQEVREQDELHAREWHERVVQLEGESRRIAEAQPVACDDACLVLRRACELSARICRLSERDSSDEGTRILCEDAQPRCDHIRAATDAACTCQRSSG